MKLFIQTSILLLLGLSIPLLSGAGESLDPNFGNNGQLTTKFSIYDDIASAVTVQPDGKILVAGQSENGSDSDIAIARYLNDGSLDKSFNVNGQVTVAVGSGNDIGLALAIQEDGKILVAGTTDNGNDLDVAVIRLHADGLPDMDFDQDGQVVIPLPDSDDMAQSILLQKDEKIILAGTSEGKDTTQIFLARLNSNGSLDTKFGSRGLVTSTKADTDQKNSAALSAALQVDGRILLAGFSSTGAISRAALFSFLENGQVDKKFGNNGIALSGKEDINSLFYDLAILEDRKILAAGTTLGKSYRSILLAGFTHDGTADQTFADQGMLQTDLGIDSVAYSLAIAKDGSIYLAGSGSKNQDTDFILLHYSATGHALDTEAPTETKEAVEEEEEEETALNLSPLEVRDSMVQPQSYTLTDFSEYNDIARAVYIQKDGTIILVGSAENGTDSDFAVLRYSSEELARIRKAGGIHTPDGYYIVTTPTANVTRNSVTTGGYLAKDNSSATVDKRGVCYGITPAPGLKDFSDSESTPDDGTGTSNTITDVADFNPFKVNTLREGCTDDGDGDGEFRSDILDLTPDTTYYIRAYAQLTSSSGTLYNIYGNELQIKTKDACFIATAAYGDINNIQVTILRQFRDTFLRPSTLGRELISSYYHVSLPLADIISGNSFLQQITRVLLMPVTALSYLALHPLFALQLFAGLFIIATLMQFSRFFSANRKPDTANRAFRSSQGFTLIELLVVLVIIGILAGYVGPRIMGHPDDAKRTMAAAQMTALETALESYKLDNGAFPSTEQGLQALIEAPSVGKLPAKWRQGGYMKKGKVPKDPWGNEYIYLSPGTHTDFDIISYGADNESGGENADADVNNWEIE